MSATRVTITVEFDHDDVAARFGIQPQQVPQFARDFAADVAAIIRCGGPDPTITYQETP